MKKIKVNIGVTPKPRKKGETRTRKERSGTVRAVRNMLLEKKEALDTKKTSPVKSAVQYFNKIKATQSRNRNETLTNTPLYGCMKNGVMQTRRQAEPNALTAQPNALTAQPNAPIERADISINQPNALTDRPNASTERVDRSTAQPNAQDIQRINIDLSPHTSLTTDTGNDTARDATRNEPPQLKHRAHRGKRRTYKVGKSGGKSIGVMMYGNRTRKAMHAEHVKKSSISIPRMRNELRNRWLMRGGSQAPPGLIKDTYMNISSIGDVVGVSSDNFHDQLDNT